jgi:outer membrane protein assembly factor BamD (BamD/ComL family)
MKDLPLTPELLKKSQDSSERATFTLGKLYFESLEDYAGTIETLEGLLTKYPATAHKAEALFILNYCYNKTGNIAKAAETKQTLEQDYSGSEYQRMVSNPGAGTRQSIDEKEMTRRYESIYNSFIEGRFDQALDEKKIADSLYGTNYWTPQLLYIQSVYHIKQRADDQAKVVLQQIIKLYPTSELAPRAQTMLDVLGRRKEIEDYLTNLKIERPGEDSSYIVKDDQVVKRVVIEMPPVVDSTSMKQSDSALAIQELEDNLRAKPGGVKPVADASRDTINTGIVKVVAGQMPDTFSRSAPGIKTDSLLAQMPKITTDTVTSAPPKTNRDTAAGVAGVTRVDSSLAANKPKPVPVINSVYTADADAPHLVIIILDKVDPVYVGEAKNAFNRYNKQTFFNTQIETVNQPLTDSLNLVVISPFPNASAALEYTRATSAIAETRIIPWMPKGKFSFVVITQPNLEMLKNRKDLSEYLRFHGQAYSGK